MKLKCLGLILLALLITGCAVKVAPMSKKVQSKIDTIDTSLIIKQSNLDVTVTQTDASSAGLLGVLVASAIDSARRSSAETEATPILKNLENYDFRQVMLKETISSLSSLEKIKVNLPVQLDNIGSELTLKIAYDKSTADGVLICYINYKLQSKKLMVNLNARLYPKSKVLKTLRPEPNELNPYDNGNVVYNNKFSFIKENITANNIQESLNEATINLAKQLSVDLDYGI